MTINDLKTYTVLPSTTTPQTEPSTPKSFGQKLGNFGKGLGNIVGGTKIGEYIGSKIAEQTPAAKQLKQDPIIQEQMEKTGSNLFETPTAKQIGGDVLKSATTVAGAALPGTGSLAGKVGQGLGIGYSADVANKLTNDQSNPLTPGLGTAVGGGITNRWGWNWICSKSYGQII